LLSIVGFLVVRRTAPAVGILWGLTILVAALYAWTSMRFVVGYERTVVLVLFITLVLAAVGLARLIDALPDRIYPHARRAVAIVAVIVAVAIVPTYTTQLGWTKLVAVDTERQEVLLPGAPVVTAYAYEDEWLFSALEGERFLAVPWKGTTVAVATGNIPVTTQPGTISIQPGLYHTFINAPCEEKRAIAAEYDIAYVFTHRFACPGFEKMATNTEGLVLQKVVE
jgi:hypothetical protein